MIKCVFRRNMRYLIILFVVHYMRKILSIIMGKLIHFGDNLSLTFIMFLAEFFGGLSVVIYHHFFFLKNNKGNKSAGIELIYEKKRINRFDGLAKIMLLIFFSSFFDFTEFLIFLGLSGKVIISPTSQPRLCIIMTVSSSFLCSFALKLKTGKHHTFSLIGMGICSIIIFILELIYKSKDTEFGNFILALLLFNLVSVLISFIDVIEKYLVEYNYYNKFKVLSLEGFFGFFLTLIYSFIIKQNPIDTIRNFYKELDIGKSFLMIFFLILYFTLAALVNIYKIICNVIYTPMVKSLPTYLLNPIFITYYFIFENDFRTNGKRDYFYYTINLILSIIIDIFAFIYNEFFILNIFGLDKDTHNNISERALRYSFMELEEGEINDDKDIKE